MKPDSRMRDLDILNHIIKYCDEVEEAVEHFGKDKDAFIENVVYKNAVGMPIQTIGELTKHFSEEFISSNITIPWKEIRGMRNYFAHKYWDMDVEAIWKTVIEDIPNLKKACMEILQTLDAADKAT